MNLFGGMFDVLLYDYSGGNVQRGTRLLCQTLAGQKQLDEALHDSYLLAMGRLRIIQPGRRVLVAEAPKNM